MVLDSRKDLRKNSCNRSGTSQLLKLNKWGTVSPHLPVDFDLGFLPYFFGLKLFSRFYFADPVLAQRKEIPHLQWIGISFPPFFHTRVFSLVLVVSVMFLRHEPKLIHLYSSSNPPPSTSLFAALIAYSFWIFGISPSLGSGFRVPYF